VVIIDLPTGQDFAQASINLLNLAWEIAIESIRAYDYSVVIHPNDMPVQNFTTEDGVIHAVGGPDTTYTPEERSAAETEFWRRSQPSLGNALALVQQSIELAIKGRIATVSPFLLIARDARDYPSGSLREDVSFSAFRTLDAADLMRAHDTFCIERLGDAFGTWWDKIRRERNSLIHSVSPGADIVRPVELLERILFANKVLHPGESWFARRLFYAENNEIQVAYHPDPKDIYGSVLVEFQNCIENLAPKTSREYFSFDHRARRYLCVACQDDCDGDSWYEYNLGNTGQINPKGAATTTLRCFLCARITSIMRVSCPSKTCRSNVLCALPGEHFKTCLTCREEWGQAEDDDDPLAPGSHS
jgi:hypothetical protein